MSAKGRLPPQKQVVTVSENKKQFIRIIVEILIAEAVVPGGNQSRLIITGQEESPVEIAPGGVVIRREDLKTTHELADAIIAQAIYATKDEGKHVVVVTCDTDVYILLLYNYHSESSKIPMKLQSTQTGRAFLDVSATVLNVTLYQCVVVLEKVGC